MVGDLFLPVLEARVITDRSRSLRDATDVAPVVLHKAYTHA